MSAKNTQPSVKNADHLLLQGAEKMRGSELEIEKNLSKTDAEGIGWGIGESKPSFGGWN